MWGGDHWLKDVAQKIWFGASVCGSRGNRVDERHILLRASLMGPVTVPSPVFNTVLVRFRAVNTSTEVLVYRRRLVCRRPRYLVRGTIELTADVLPLRAQD
jgi:hypothetical protein